MTVLIHSGSRGLGHQVCTDYVKRMDAALARYGIELPDRQLACAPLVSAEGRAYLGAMAAAANFAWANRQAIAHARPRGGRAGARRGERADGTRLVYDVAHNIAKLERYGGRRAVRAPQGRDARLPAGLAPRSPATTATSASRSSSRAAWAPRASCWSGRQGAMRALVRHDLPRRRPPDEPHRRAQADRRRRAAPAARGRRDPSAARRTAASPRRRRSPTRTSSGSSSVVERAGLARRVARLRPIGVVKG